MLTSDGVAGFTTRKVAEQATTSTPAVYELFGDKAGLVREMFFEGFRMLYRLLQDLGDSGDPCADMIAPIPVLRDFAMANAALADLMFSRPFPEFDPGPAERQAGAAVREFIVGRVRRCVEAGIISADPTDIAHVLSAAIATSSCACDSVWRMTAVAPAAARAEISAAATSGVRSGAGMSPRPTRIEAVRARVLKRARRRDGCGTGLTIRRGPLASRRRPHARPS